jgi:RNA polymerase sigma-70 factor (ECF subfamily)
MDSMLEQPCEEAFRQVLAHRTMLKAYVTAMVRDASLAEDTFSDVTLEIARSWQRFDRGRPFESWARGVARRVALANLRKHSRQPVQLDEEVLEAIGAELDQAGDEAQLEVRKQALQHCLTGLSASSREMVRLRYFEQQSYTQVSSALGRNVGALYVAFNRIHRALAHCIGKALRSS